MSTMTTTVVRQGMVLITAIGLVGHIWAQGPEARREAFEALVRKVQRDVASVSEAEVLQMIRLGQEVGRPYSAAIAAKNYLSSHLSVSPELVLAAAESARWSGDFRTAAARYKQYLKTAPPGPEASRAYAHLGRILIDFLGAYDDAFQFMSEMGLRFRQTVEARRFDAWVIAAARDRRAFAPLTAWLVAVFQDRLPIEQERLYYWGYLDWLLAELGEPRPEMYAALPDLRRLVALIRDDVRRPNELAFEAEYLAFCAGAAGKDTPTLEKEFETVLAAARRYVEAAPQAATLKRIGLAWTKGPGWDVAAAKKRDFFAWAMTRLDDAGRQAMVEWTDWDMNRRILAPEQWAELLVAHPEAFRRSSRTGSLNWPVSSPDPALHRRLAPFLQGQPTPAAAVIRSWAASEDLYGALVHLTQKESWALDFPDPLRLLNETLWPAFRQFPREAGKELPPDDLRRIRARYAIEHLFRSPVAIFCPEQVQASLQDVWEVGGRDPQDKRPILAALALLDWVPYTEEQRRQIVGAGYAQFKTWADGLRRTHETARSRKEAADRALNEARKAQADAAQRLTEHTKALAETQAARQAAEQTLAERKAALAAAEKRRQDAHAAVQAAEAAKDEGRWARARAEFEAAQKALADAAAQLQHQDKVLQDLVAKLAEFEARRPALEAERRNRDEAVAAAQKAFEESAREATSVEAIAAPIVEMEEAFKRASDPRTVDVSKAPHPLCRSLAEAVLAVRSRQADRYRELARAIYQEVRDCDVKGTPLGSAILRWLITNRSEVDLLDFQCEVLEDQFARCTPTYISPLIWTVTERVMQNRSDLVWNNTSAQHKSRAQKLNQTLEKGLLHLLDQGQFVKDAFEWLRMTRRGQGWFEPSWNTNVLVRMIERKILHEHPSARYAHLTATCSYMWLIRNEFTPLQAAFPLETYFDAMYAEEIQKTRLVEGSFWDYGGDRNRDVATTAAQIMQEFSKAPLGYNEVRPVYPGDSFWQACSRALMARPEARDALLRKWESWYGSTRFDGFAMGRESFAFGPDATLPEGRKQFFEKLAQYVRRAETSPARVPPPYLPQLGQLGDPGKLTDAERAVLERLMNACQPAWWGGMGGIGSLVEVVQEAWPVAQRGIDLLNWVPQFWKITRDTGDGSLQRKLLQFAGRLAETGQVDLAAAYAAVGLELGGGALTEEVRNGLLAVRAKSLSSVGMVIPVDRSDRRFPIYAAQAAWLAGKLDNAWDLYLSQRSLVHTEFKQLDPQFCLWLVAKLTDVGQYAEAESLAQKMIQWMDVTPQGFDPDLRAQLLVAYADLSLARQEYPRARAQYERVAVAREFEGTLGRRMAEVKMAEVDRLSKQYDRAMDQLEKLARRRDAYLQAEANYQMALIKFEQEEYLEARKYLDRLLALDLHHPNGRILEGRLYLKMKKLVEATDVKVGLSATQQTVVPGKPLKVQLEDKNLAVVGRAAHIEIRAWTQSGDEEIFSLLPFGDSKTKFEGQILTALGPPQKGDRVLQVLGDDVVFYDYSPRFRAANKIVESEPLQLRVASDSDLYVSSGRILTREEQERRTLERLLLARLQLEDRASEVALSTVRREDEVKPGAGINIRVVDPDRSVTADRDRVTVRVSASSGDRVSAFVLEETEPFSGVFEGRIPTATASATAYASDSEEGKEPNFAISSGSYPPWTALADNRRPKMFTVDLNRNAPLGHLTLVADVPGRRLRRWILQTSLNGREFHSVAVWPVNLPSWDGAPRLELVRYADADRPPRTLAEFQQYLSVDYAAKKAEKFYVTPASFSMKWDGHVMGYGDRMGLSWDGNNSWYLARITAAFELPERTVKSFRLDPRGVTQNARYLLVVDDQEAKDGLEFSQSLSKGVHQIELYLAFQRRVSPNFQLLMDSAAPPYWTRVSEDLFDPTQHPQIRDRVAFTPATVATNSDGTQFDVTFPPHTEGRAVRLWLADFETDAPAIRKITLRSPEGHVLVPPTEDVVRLKENQTLEIVPGDRITVTYEDERFVSKEKRVQEAFLTATYHNATLSACLVESIVDSGGSRVPRYIPLRRFRPGDAVSIFLHDPDGDVSEQRDRLRFAARSSEGKPVDLEALETDAHSGVFIGRVFPVTGDPQRPSEVKVGSGDDLILTYLDTENTDPGIPWTRSYVIEQAVFAPPDLRCYETVSYPLSTNEIAAAQGQRDERRLEEWIPPLRSAAIVRPESRQEGTTVSALFRFPLVVELTYPTIALSPLSKATLYVQTEAGRQKAGKSPEDEFDLDVAGTIRIDRFPGDVTSLPPPPGYRETRIRGNPLAQDALDDGRFMFLVPLKLGDVPERSLAHVDPMAETDGTASDEDVTEMTVSLPVVDERGKIEWRSQRVRLPTLRVRGDDHVYVGFAYTDERVGSNGVRWITRRVALRSDPFFDLMDARYQQVLKSAHVGETVFLRIIDPARDLTSEQDTVEVGLLSGTTNRILHLHETYMHSGVFKGMIRLVYAGDPRKPEEAALPVRYGDRVTARYTSREGEVLERTLWVHQGADGRVLPFTKRFKDPEIAVQTQFTMAEAFFELAKKHREIGQEPLARQEIAQGKRLLEEALRDHPTTEARAQAEYLLAELALEFGNDAVDPAVKKQYYLEAIHRFSTIVATYPESPYAPKAQFKKGLTFEKMGQLDEACEEYVKLSYRYPDNELVAETMARLGQYFLTKGKELQDKAAAAPNVVEQEKIKMQARDLFKTAAQVFGRLAPRFPTHQLAGRASVLSGQCYMRAEDYPKAIVVFRQVIEDKKAESELLAQAMYWCGDCYMKQRDYVNAYRMFKKLTWDYPESLWAKYARGRLTEDVLVQVETKEATGGP